MSAAGLVCLEAFVLAAAGLASGSSWPSSPPVAAWALARVTGLPVLNLKGHWVGSSSFSWPSSPPVVAWASAQVTRLKLTGHWVDSSSSSWSSSSPAVACASALMTVLPMLMEGCCLIQPH
jgi:hypothetical protein